MQADYPRIAILGAGNMAEGILQCALEKKVVTSRQVIAADVSPQRRQLFGERFGVETTADSRQALDGADVALLAVKPQNFRELAKPLGRGVRPDCLVISIMAGVPTAAIEAAFGGQARVVRVMPNLPIRLGVGVAGLYRGAFATQADEQFAVRLFEAGGKAIGLADEDLLDAVTAISGSGPAYYYYFVEAMTDAGVMMGLTREQSQLLAEYACLGAARMMVETGEEPADLRAKVTSKGGTTQAAIESMERAGVREKIIVAVMRARERAKELAQG